ncbi:PspC domain-containing protein [Agromyces sp. H66]|uniref:PspC domain-containing protein n=1 Tax=Agromyces sp. H66 TaxID=2529859 RepID=UPI0010AADFEE|nr:PspC domain-containing protein [Agromyces sp. H66]
METNPTAPETDPAPNDVKGDSTPAGRPVDGAVGSTPPGTPEENGDGFFGWLRRLGVPRRPGWLGGVAAGVAARLGIDPLIVRGIVVVVAVLGAPFVLLYAIAWLLLPDTDGRIHLERLLRGTVDPAIVGIAVMSVIGFIPLVQGGWLGWRWWPDWPSIWVGGIDVLAPVRVLWVLAVIAGITVLVVWLIRRANASTSGVGAASDASGVAATSGPSGVAATSAPSVAFAPAPGTGPAPEPPAPAMGADADEIAAWRAQHEAWRRSHADWRQSQQDAERAARARAAAENKARAEALAAESEAARRRRRAERPRAGAAYVFTVLGIALVGAALAAIWALGAPQLAGHVAAVALAVSTLVLALGMFVAAVRRRRAGFLAFVTAVSTLAMLGAALPPGRTFVPPGYGISMLESQSVVQPIGDAHLVASADLHRVTGTPEVELTQVAGNVYLTIMGDIQVELDARDAGRVEVLRFTDAQTATSVPTGDTDEILTFGRDRGAPADARLVVHQPPGGTIYVTIHERAG